MPNTSGRSPMSQTSTAFLETPIGWLRAVADESALLAVDFVEAPASAGPGRPAVLAAALAELEAYFRGERTSFSVPLRLEGTPFQRRVWDRLLLVPYGRTTTYGDLARTLGN